MGIPEKIKAIQDEMARTQINKATEHHLGLLKAKIAKLKREQEEIVQREMAQPLRERRLYALCDAITEDGERVHPVPATLIAEHGNHKWRDDDCQ